MFAIAVLGLVALCRLAEAFSSTVITYQALTVTATATTKTISFNQATPTTIIIVPDATLTLPAITVTQAVQPDFCQGSFGNACRDIENLAPQVTSFDAAQLSAIVSQIDPIYSTYKTGQPFPNPVLIQSKILLYLDNAQFIDRIAAQLFPFNPTSYIQDALDALAPLPTLQADASSYVDYARSYFAPLELAEASIVSKELSLTGAAPSWISYAASVAAAETSGSGGTSGGSSSTGTASISGTSGGPSSTGTASTSASASSTKSPNAAAPTLVNSLLINACAAAVGILGIANL